MKINLRNGNIEYHKHFIPASLAFDYFHQLQQELQWRQDSVLMYGKMLAIPRLQAWYGDPDLRYVYSNISLDTTPWTPLLEKLRDRISQQCGHEFNTVLANNYRNQRDSVSWHSDDEPELGRNPVVASLSFGATRDFQLRHNQTKEKINIALTPGSLLVMQGETQHFWQHCVPKRTRDITSRINLTFRKIKDIA